MHPDVNRLPRHQNVSIAGATVCVPVLWAQLTQVCCRYIGGVNSTAQGTLTGGYLAALTALTSFSVSAPGVHAGVPLVSIVTSTDCGIISQMAALTALTSSSVSALGVMLLYPSRGIVT